MNPGPNSDLLRRRVAFAIMCFRFGINPQNPPNPQTPVPVDLSTDLARSIERQRLTSQALLFLQDRPFLPFTWQPVSQLDLFKNLNFQKYHALCFMQLRPALSAHMEIRETLRGMEMAAAESFEATTRSLADEDLDEALSPLLTAAGDQVEEFSRNIADFPMALEG
jgi:hypothetical protein